MCFSLSMQQPNGLAPFSTYDALKRFHVEGTS
jgi:hypothetical protein